MPIRSIWNVGRERGDFADGGWAQQKGDAIFGMNDYQKERVVYPSHDMTALPWKNGGGVTREVARDREGLSPNWRMSIADLEHPGAFSCFEGRQRHFGVLGERPVVLSFPDRQVTLATGDVLIFEGDEPVVCELPDGPSRALNLMFDAKRWDGHLMLCEPWAWPLHESGEAPWEECWYILSRGRLMLDPSTPNPVVVGPGDALRYPLTECGHALPGNLRPIDESAHGLVGFGVQLKRHSTDLDPVSSLQRM
ncbi:HutD family protein [Salinicola sp. CPA57]|uniref:HutD/Ves family protein n=1 Tax=Salinicola sp. CPA57 TaxID=1949080 RepID=UPI000DA1D68E|nr:HutD family protein [Salinicola sp. CPA57]